MSTHVFPSMNTPAPTPANQVDNYTSAGGHAITIPTGARYCIFEGISGGGSGHNSSSGDGCGGAGGGYIRMLFDVTDLTNGETLTVGAGGTGGANSFGGATSFHGVSVTGAGSGYSRATSQIALPGGIVGCTSMSNPAGGKLTGGFLGGSGNTNGGASSQFGGGGGSSYQSSVLMGNGLGGTAASAVGALKAGDGAKDGVSAAQAPGGGGAASSNATYSAGAAGAARLTWIF